MCIFFAGALTGTFTTYLYQPHELYKVKKDTVPNICNVKKRNGNVAGWPKRWKGYLVPQD